MSSQIPSSCCPQDFSSLITSGWPGWVGALTSPTQGRFPEGEIKPQSLLGPEVNQESKVSKQETG